MTHLSSFLRFSWKVEESGPPLKWQITGVHELSTPGQNTFIHKILNQPRDLYGTNSHVSGIILAPSTKSGVWPFLRNLIFSIFGQFEPCGISLGMFEWVKWQVLWNLSLINIIMMIREKKIGTLSTEIGPAATKIVKFWPKKAYHRTCALQAPN